MIYNYYQNIIYNYICSHYLTTIFYYSNLLFIRLYDWKTMNRRDVRDIIKSQAPNTQLEFEQRTKEVILQFAEQVCCLDITNFFRVI